MAEESGYKATATSYPGVAFIVLIKEVEQSYNYRGSPSNTCPPTTCRETPISAPIKRVVCTGFAVR